MATIRAEIEMVLRIAGTVEYDEQGYIEHLDGNPADNDSILEYIASDPDWHEGSDFPIPHLGEHIEVIESEVVSVNDNLAPVFTSPDFSTTTTGATDDSR